MRRFRDMHEWNIERLFGRTAPAANDSLDDISWFVRDVQSAHPETTVDEATASVHVSAMLDAASLSAENGDPAAKPVSKAHGPASQVSGLPKLRRKLVLSNLFASLAARIAAGTVAALTAFSGMAVAGVLPDPAQSVAATLASYVGIDIEDPDSDDIATLDDEDAAKLDEDEVEDEGDEGDDGDDTDVTDDANDTVGATGDDTGDTADTVDTAESVDTVSEDTASVPSAPSADTADSVDTDDAAEERADFEQDAAEERADFEQDQAEDAADHDDDDSEND